MTLFSEHGRRVRSLALSHSIDCMTVSVSADGRDLAFVEPDSGALWVLDVDTGHEAEVARESAVTSCRFDVESRLWTVRALPEGFVVELRAAGTHALVASAAFGDAYFAAGGACIHRGPDSRSVLLETYSGQSEQEHYLCEWGEGARLRIQHFPALDGNESVFAAEAGELAVSFDHSDPAVVTCRIPPGEPITRVPWPDYVEEDGEDERPGYDACFLNRTHVLVGSQEGRLFVFDAPRGTFVSEIHVEGHAPVPLSEKYPSLSDQGLVSDLASFGRCGESVVAFFAGAHRASADYVVLPITELLDL
jgi:hypothetical protein